MSERDELAGIIRDHDELIDGCHIFEAADAILAAGYRKPEVIERERMSIENGWLVYQTGRHTCAGGDEAASYHHEPDCGLEPLDDLTEVLARSGYHEHQVIRTSEELDALPVGSVVLDVDGEPWRKMRPNLWASRDSCEESATVFWAHSEIHPTVIHTPGHEVPPSA